MGRRKADLSGIRKAPFLLCYGKGAFDFGKAKEQGNRQQPFVYYPVNY